jgi:hypothetical protein
LLAKKQKSKPKKPTYQHQKVPLGLLLWLSSCDLTKQEEQDFHRRPLPSLEARGPSSYADTSSEGNAEVRPILWLRANHPRTERFIGASCSLKKTPEFRVCMPPWEACKVL